MGDAGDPPRAHETAPSAAFVPGFLILAAVIGGIILLVWALRGFGEGSDGSFAALAGR